MQTWKPTPLYYCFVSKCKNSSTSTPNKLFFKVPYNNRKAWCEAAGRKDLPKSSLDVCEDHIKPVDDVENYVKWKYSSFRPKLKSKVPSKLVAQNYFEQVRVEQCEQAEPSSSSKYIQPYHFCEEISIQCAPEHKEAAVSATVTTKSIGVNTKPLRIPQRFNDFEISELSDSETVPSSQSSENFTVSGSVASSSPIIEKHASPIKEKYSSHTLNMLSLVQQKPFQYLGLPKIYFWLLEYISKNTKVPEIHLITVLYKIKQSDPFHKIADLFNMSETTLSRNFPKTINVLAKIFNSFIYMPDKFDIKRNLPLAFTCNKEYANTQCIIDCFEVEVEKPTNPIHQAASWSQYKSCNTIKFLISATPDGFINFISEGYGGRVSDIKLVQLSGFLNVLKPNSTVLADRGFKHLETILHKKSVRLIRPPSVSSSAKMTKSEVIATKVIASLRIHIERVIRRVRQFKFLKPHSTINNKLVDCIDDVVVVACGLINLQSPIIKAF